MKVDNFEAFEYQLPCEFKKLNVERLSKLKWCKFVSIFVRVSDFFSLILKAFKSLKLWLLQLKTKVSNGN